MNIFMVGEAAKHSETLERHLDRPHGIVALPRAAAYSAAHDSEIGPDDVLISLRLRRDGTALPAPRLLHVPGAGLDGIEIERLSPNTSVCNVFEHEIPIAEFVLASMLDHEIGLAALRASFTPSTWSETYRSRRPHGELSGKTLVILGFGRIGRAIAVRARAFGVHVVAVDAVPPAADAPAAETAVPGALAACLSRADYAVLCCPLSAATRGLIDAEKLAAMKPDGVLINVSRAEIVDEDALFEALKSRAIGGAILDVWYRYPQSEGEDVPPSRHPFHELDNAACTPHSSAWTSALPGRRYAFMADNINRLAAGQPLRNLVAGRGA